MLVLTRRPGSEDSEILIDLPDGQTIKIQVVEIRKGACRIGIDAPKNLPIRRGELPSKKSD
jgi:carbon storage regulator CsrA